MWTWRGWIHGHEVSLELLPEAEGLLLDLDHSQSMQMHLPDQRLAADFENHNFLDPDGNQVISFGPTRIGKSICGVGRPSLVGCLPFIDLEMVVLQGDPLSEALEEEVCFLVEDLDTSMLLGSGYEKAFYRGLQEFFGRLADR